GEAAHRQRGQGPRMERGEVCPVARGLRRARRLIAVAVVAIALCTVPAAADAAPSPSPSPAGGSLVVPLPPGVTLKPGTYDVTVRGAGTEVTTKVTVPGHPSQGTVASGGTGGGAGTLAVVLVSLALIVAVVAVGVGARFRWRGVLPRPGSPQRRPAGR